MNKNKQAREAVNQEKVTQQVSGPNLEPWSAPGIRKYRDLKTGEIVRAVHYTGGNTLLDDFQSIVELTADICNKVSERNDLNPTVVEILYPSGDISIIDVGDTVYINENNLICSMSSTGFLYFFESVSGSNGYIGNTDEEVNIQKEIEDLKVKLNNSESLSKELMKMLEEDDREFESLKLIIKELTKHI